MDVTVSENQDAVFRCRHEGAVFINWLINGKTSTEFSDVVMDLIRESNGTNVRTLTIPAIPIYNGTVVVCVATLIGSNPETTPPVILTIAGQL